MFFRERQQVIICVLAVVMIIGFTAFCYLPLQKRSKAVEQVKAEHTLVITKASAEMEQLPVLEKQLMELQKAVKNYEVKVPPQRNLGEFLHTIAKLMNDRNLKAPIIQPGQEVESDKLNCVPVNMQCKGKLSEIFEFYKRLQGLDRLVRIEQVELVNDGSFSGEVNMQTKAVIYYQPEARRG